MLIFLNGNFSIKRHNGVEAKLGRDQAKAQWGIAFSTEKNGRILGQVTVELFDFYVLPKSQYVVSIIDNEGKIVSYIS